jgi:hypothetical protein
MMAAFNALKAYGGPLRGPVPFWLRNKSNEHYRTTNRRLQSGDQANESGGFAILRVASHLASGSQR